MGGLSEDLQLPLILYPELEGSQGRLLEVVAFKQNPEGREGAVVRGSVRGETPVGLELVMRAE